ncbi:hypothetical protein BP5796_00742 [Coleophoma crateriformis]|uniref:Uncharacterized protein n=1 Tax=Coleophoma crateriformis TaxID=565419 RepID=A0A3D8T8T3_9HELO|nr:hypothetical protein BP5796_00742 [Coleophoma crateriformis]
MAAITKVLVPKHSIFQVRLSAIVPVICSTAALVLTSIAVLSGTKPGMFDDSYLMRFNTTALGQNIIDFQPVSTAVKVKRLDNPFTLLPNPLGLPTLTLPNPSLPTNLPAPTVPAVLTSIPAALTSLFPIPTALGQNPLAAINNAFQDITGNLSGLISSGLNGAEAGLVQAVEQKLGIAQYYTLHVLNICEGTSRGGSGMNITKCKHYTDKTSGVFSLIAAVPSSVIVLNSKITVPILGDVSEMGQLLKSLSPILGTFYLAIYIVSIIGSAGSALLTLVEIFFRPNRIVLRLSMLTATLASLFHGTAALSASVGSVAITSVVNSIGDGIGLDADEGSSFLALVWVAWVLSVVTSAKINLRDERLEGNLRGSLEGFLVTKGGEEASASRDEDNQEKTIITKRKSKAEK